MRHADVPRELSAGDALFVRCHKPDRHEPLAKFDFAVLENRPDTDRKTFPASAALVSATIGKVIDLRATAMRAIGPIMPTERGQMINRGLLVGERRHHLEQRIEVLHGGRRFHAPSYHVPNPLQENLGHTGI